MKMKQLATLLLLATLLIGCAPPEPTSTNIVALETPSYWNATLRGIGNRTVLEITPLAQGYFENGVFRFQDVVGDHVVTCWVVDGYESIGIECLELD